MIEMKEVPTTQSITITRAEYEDLLIYKAEWDSIYNIFNKCNKDVAYNAVKALVCEEIPEGIKDESKEIDVIGF